MQAPSIAACAWRSTSDCAQPKSLEPLVGIVVACMRVSPAAVTDAIRGLFSDAGYSGTAALRKAPQLQDVLLHVLGQVPARTNADGSEVQYLCDFAGAFCEVVHGRSPFDCLNRFV